MPVGDCSDDGEVSIDELIGGVNIALGMAPLSQCTAFYPDGNEAVEITELVAAVNAALVDGLRRTAYGLRGRI